MSETIRIDWDELREVIKQTLLDADYDIFKAWDPDYEGREDPAGSTWDDLTDRWWTYFEAVQ